MPRRTSGLLAVLAMLAGFSAGAAGAAEINVAVAGAMRPVMNELIPAFEKSSGHKVTVEYAPAGKIDEKVRGDDTVDVAILPKPRFDKLVGAGKMAGGSATPLARVELGLAVKNGAPKPDIGSDEGLKKALLGAKSIALNDPTSGSELGIYLTKMIDKLGIAGEVKSKLHPVPPSTNPRTSQVILDMVQQGKADIALLAVNEAIGFAAVEIVPLPADLQSADLGFVGGTPWTCEQPLAAKDFLDFLTSASAKAIYKSKAMTPS